jgi:hypothetical protein
MGRYFRFGNWFRTLRSEDCDIVREREKPKKVEVTTRKNQNEEIFKVNKKLIPPSQRNHLLIPVDSNMAGLRHLRRLTLGLQERSTFSGPSRHLPGTPRSGNCCGAD